MRNDGTHIPSVEETFGNTLHRFVLKIRGSMYTWWNKKKFAAVGSRFYAPGPIHVVNGKRIRIGDEVFLGERCQLYAFPESEIYIGDHTSIDRYVEIRGGKLVRIGPNVRIARGATLKTTNDSNMIIGERTLISQGCILDGDFQIGSDVMLAPRVFLNGYDHGHTNRDVPMNRQAGIKASVIIEDDVWIGYNAVLLKGVTIRKGSIVAANAVVTKPTESYSINAGIPSTILKMRN